MDRGLLLRIGFQVAVTAVFLFLAVRLVDLGSLWSTIKGINLWWVAVALPLFTCAKFVDSFRWRFLLRGVGRPPQLSLFGAFIVGNMVNNLLPFRAGDVAKIQVLASRYGLSRAGIAGSVFVVEATLDGVVFILFLALGTAFLDLERVPGVTSQLVLGLVLLAVVALGLAVLLRMRGQELPVGHENPIRPVIARSAGSATLRSGGCADVVPVPDVALGHATAAARASRSRARESGTPSPAGRLRAISAPA